MFTQFFGHFLLEKKILTSEQLLLALTEQTNARIKLGTLAIHAGLMTANEVERVIILQTKQDQRFGEIAVAKGYLTSDQVNDLIERQSPEYLVLGQILVEQNIITHAQFEQLLSEYQTENELFELDMLDEQKDKVLLLIKNFCKLDNLKQQDLLSDYILLLFNNLIRFIGDDFTPLTVLSLAEYPTTSATCQEITGTFALKTILDGNKETMIQFASRYAKDSFQTYDEFVEASVDEFFNLHNGLFLVNISNSKGIELDLLPPTRHDNELITIGSQSFVIPIMYTFGTIHIVISLV
jgi:hypothetical protein